MRSHIGLFFKFKVSVKELLNILYEAFVGTIIAVGPYISLGVFKCFRVI
jgi:hypothetical protein